MTAAFGQGDVAGAMNDLLDLVFIAIAPLGILLILGMMLRRAARAVRKWWPTHRVLTAALVALVAGALFVQGQALVSRLVPQPRTPSSPRPREQPPRQARTPTPPPPETTAPSGPVVQPRSRRSPSRRFVYVVAAR